MSRRKVYEVKDCFEFECPKRWEELEATNKATVKFCNQCEKNVYKATSEAKLKKYAEEGKCVAYFHYEHPIIGMQAAPPFENISNNYPNPDKFKD